MSETTDSSSSTPRPGPHGLPPAMPLSGPVTAPGAIWVGANPPEPGSGEPPERIPLVDAEGFERARFLIRDGHRVRGLVTVPVVQDPEGFMIDTGALRSAIDGLPAAPQDPAPESVSGTITVVIPTRDRPDHLRIALGSVLACADDDFDVVVVDNASTGTGTVDVVRELDDSRVRVVAEAVPGISRARNRGVLETAAPWIAFTDDDVSVDPGWLAGIRRGFARAEEVGIVTGLVPAGELRTPTQRWFESRVTWGRLLRPQVYRLSAPPADMPLFPFQVGVYGTGANMAVRREVYLALGGADELLGAGSSTKGGEDLDLFLRVLRAGHALVVEPSAVVWHRHRAELGDLDSQVVGYGRGLGALTAKIVLRPATLSMAVRRVPAAVRRLSSLGEVAGSGEALTAEAPLPRRGMSRLARKELLSLLAGPVFYLRARRGGRVRPLLDERG